MRTLAVPFAAFWLSFLPATGSADEVGTAVYVRSDTDRTTVVSPRLRAKHQAQGTSVEAAYVVDVWTSASVDIRTSATKVIRDGRAETPNVTEQRDEIDLSVSHEFEDMTVGGAYRYSTEYDYTSHAGTLSGSRDFANKAATLAGSLSLARDTVGRAGDPGFSRHLGTVDTRVSFTQVIDPSMLAQVTYELMLLDGYQASPYRYVGIDGTGLGCEAALACPRESLPDKRARHAMALQVRRAFGPRASAGLGYRMYLDDWGVTSHTAQAHATWLPWQPLTLTLRYRYYLQSAASFYRAIYSQEDALELSLTRDRELSPLNAHRVGLDLGHDWDLGDVVLRSVISLGVTQFAYDDFVGLDQATAFEITGAFAVRDF